MRVRRSRTAERQTAIAVAGEALPGEFVWVDSADQMPPNDNGAVAHNCAIIRPGNIHPLNQSGPSLSTGFRLRSLFSGLLSMC